MEFHIRNYGGPALCIEVTNTGYRIDGLKVPADFARLFDASILNPEIPNILDSLIDIYMGGIGPGCKTSESDVLNVISYVQEYWELEPC